MKLANYFNLLKIEHLEGGTYNVESILNAIKTLTNWALSVGIAAAGTSLVIGFILYAENYSDITWYCWNNISNITCKFNYRFILKRGGNKC